MAEFVRGSIDPVAAEMQAVEVAAWTIEQMLRAVQARSWRSIPRLAAYLTALSLLAAISRERHDPMFCRPEE